MSLLLTAKDGKKYIWFEKFILYIFVFNSHTKFIKTYKDKLAKVSKIIFGELRMKTFSWCGGLIHSDFTEVDGTEAEIEESLERLGALGFTEDKAISEGRKDWLGSILVLTK